MKKLLLLLPLLLFLTALTFKTEFFTGKIIYQYQFTTYLGKDISEKLAPLIGSGSEYYISNKNYKSYSNQKLQQLYNAKTNIYYNVEGDTAKKIDASQVRFKDIQIKHLPLTENIAGYDCKVIQIETDNAITDYYYSPQLRVDLKAFAKHNYGEWNKYLEATNGALALKHVMRDKQSGLVWTSTATEIVPMELKASDFVLPANLFIKE